MSTLTTIDALWYARAAMGEWVSTRYWIPGAEPHQPGDILFDGNLAFRLVPIGESFNAFDAESLARYPDIVASLPALVRIHFEQRRATRNGDGRFPWLTSTRPDEIVALCRFCLADFGNPPNPEWVAAPPVFDAETVVARLEVWIHARSYGNPHAEATARKALIAALRGERT